MWNRNNRLHTRNKKQVYKERKETTHVKIGERTIITTSNVYIYIYEQVQGLPSQYDHKI